MQCPQQWVFICHLILTRYQQKWQYPLMYVRPPCPSIYRYMTYIEQRDFHWTTLCVLGECPFELRNVLFAHHHYIVQPLYQEWGGYLKVYSHLVMSLGDGIQRLKGYAKKVGKSTTVWRDPITVSVLSSKGQLVHHVAWRRGTNFFSSVQCIVLLYEPYPGALSWDFCVPHCPW